MVVCMLVGGGGGRMFGRLVMIFISFWLGFWGCFGRGIYIRLSRVVKD